MARAAQLQKVVHMAANRVKIGRSVLGKEQGEQVDSGEAAGLAQGPELVVGQVPGVGTEGVAVGMAGCHRPFGHVHDIPERLSGDMADVNENAQLLGPADKVPPLGAEAGAVHLGAARQGVVGVPGQGNHPDALGIGLLQPPRVTADALGALQGQKGRDPAAVQHALELGPAAHQSHPVPMPVQLPADIGKAPVIKRFAGIAGVNARQRADGEELAVARQLRGSGEVDMIAGALQAVSPFPHLRQRITVGVQHHVSIH